MNCRDRRRGSQSLSLLHLLSLVLILMTDQFQSQNICLMLHVHKKPTHLDTKDVVITTMPSVSKPYIVSIMSNLVSTSEPSISRGVSVGSTERSLNPTGSTGGLRVSAQQLLTRSFWSPLNSFLKFVPTSPFSPVILLPCQDCLW